ncbi:hypothetical protein B1992_00630 [Pseudoxanthomonas broegbernensis]|uniref:DUF4062 domain-containing protein n=1 Tax=Pseudoxanthomonas broegbernensis TaxID=83619 RepID=A0A7V8K8N8_9GAMM|nr:DUF4062 domain-containing protein [Pseudoxanthomonas broegbernensis]KAF1687978.1 hypothetical protein B1992_00630 [Pseudoxanthomonas broegbernensis]MBB6064993.1 hypothetical protein [Pseudoxanthomonas broegbernensis]
MRRPTFFISSTIYDFRDLRSALKFYLEDHGCKVLASECNDFEKPLDKHSYDACLEALRSADYFILLIGTRVGGWYDQTNQVSITQREYREAYQMHQAGKLKLLNFVRSEVWQAKEDRRELAKYLETIDLEPSTRKDIANYSGKTAANAEFLSKFIEEVSRNEETKRAVRGQGAAPSGNWIHVFHGFRDIVDVLNGHVFASIPVEDMTARRLLRGELREFLSQGLVKSRGEVFSPKFHIELFHKEHPITMATKGNEFTSVGARRWDILSSYGIHLLDRKFHPVVLPQVLSRPTFLEFDLGSNSYVETPVHNALVRLQKEIRRFNRSSTVDNLDVIFEYGPKRRPPGTTVVHIETIKLATLLHLFDRWSNIVDLSAAILRYLDGAPFVLPDLRLDSPVQGMQEQLDAERPTESDISAFVANPG